MDKEINLKTLVGKKVRIIVCIGDVTASYEGILREGNKWIALEIEGKKKLFNPEMTVLIEEIS